MGKATDLDDYLETHPLTPGEIKERRAAKESGGEVEATTDGQLITRPKPAEARPAKAPVVVVQAPRQTWD